MFVCLFVFSGAVQIYPCDSKPCLNNGTCSNDPQDISKYHCACPKWIVGDKCQGNGASKFSLTSNNSSQFSLNSFKCTIELGMNWENCKGLKETSLRGRRKKGRGKGEGRKGKGKGAPLPNPPPLFSFLPIPYPYPFRRLLRRLKETVLSYI